MKYVAVLCSAQDLDEDYIKPSQEFARLLPRNGYNLVWGGTDTGLMKSIAQAVTDGGGQLIGVSLPIFSHLARKDVQEMVIAKTLGERKAIILARSDAIAVLPGGIGTLDELTEILELKKQQVHDKPVVVLNVLNFYQGLKMQLEKMKKDGFIPNQLDDLLHFADSPYEAIDYINKNLNHI